MMASIKGSGTSSVSLSPRHTRPGNDTHPGKIRSPTSASFIRPTRPHDGKTDFLTALHEKYAAQHEAQKPIVFSTKVAEEVGFEKISRKQAQLNELKIVILDGMRLAWAYDSAGKRDKTIRDVCPSITELGMSRNLFTSFGPVVEICAELDHVKTLRLKCVYLGQCTALSLTITITAAIASPLYSPRSSPTALPPSKA